MLGDARPVPFSGTGILAAWNAPDAGVSVSVRNHSSAFSVADVEAVSPRPPVQPEASSVLLQVPMAEFNGVFEPGLGR